MTPVTVPTLSRLARDLFKHLLDERHGKFPTDELKAELTRELGQYDLNHVDYRSDIAQACVKYELAERSKVNPFPKEDGELQLALFAESDFQRGVIRLGDRFNVKMSDATAREWNTRAIHQQKAAQDAQEAAIRTNQFLQTEPGQLMMSRPEMTTTEAMRQLRLWPNDVEAQADDEEGDDGNQPQ